MAAHLRLGVNIDHIATVRNARGGVHPDPVRAAQIAISAGADGITAHLREDRRHIRDDDMARLKQEIDAPLNFEMAATDEMVEIAIRILPNACCLVPEKREELTTEGGLSVTVNHNRITDVTRALQREGIRVSLFIDPEHREIEAARASGADCIELHTGPYTDSVGAERERELVKLLKGARLAASLGLECHAGHGLSYETVAPVAAIPNMRELNIGHFLVGEALYSGLGEAVREMRSIMDEARKGL